MLINTNTPVKLRKNAIDMTNKKYGKLTALFPVAHSRAGTIWRFQCECGNLLDVCGVTVRRSNTKSCGCLTSWPEIQIANFLKENNISFKQQYIFPDLKMDGYLRFDFAIFDNKDNLIGLIEYNGEQHYKENVHLGGQIGYEKCQISDKLKLEYVVKNNIPFLVLNKNNFTEKVLLDWIITL